MIGFAGESSVEDPERFPRAAKCKYALQYRKRENYELELVRYLKNTVHEDFQSLGIQETVKFCILTQ